MGSFFKDSIGKAASSSKKSGKDHEAALDDGPLRFVVEQQGTVVEPLTDEQVECAETLKRKWEERFPSLVLSDALYVTFARCSPGPEPFNAKTAWKVMKKYNKSNLGLSADLLEARLSSKTLFPVPGLKSNSGCHVLYIRPSRFSPKEAPVEFFTDALAYAMHIMMEYSTEIAILVNFDGWIMKNYATDFWNQFMCMVQGQNFPVRVQSFVMINTPDWFQSVWKMMQPMLSEDFVPKVHRLENESDLGNYLMEGYQKFLPDDLELLSAEVPGVSTDELVEDFIKYRKHAEAVPIKTSRRQSLTKATSWSKRLAYTTSPRSSSTRSLTSVQSCASLDRSLK